jgi:hypothetical protein
MNENVEVRFSRLECAPAYKPFSGIRTTPAPSSIESPSHEIFEIFHATHGRTTHRLHHQFTAPIRLTSS